MKRHLFKRVVENKNGKKEVRWYYWFYNEDGKQVKKSCGKHGKPCLLKREAEAYLAELAEKDKQEEAARYEAQKVRLRDVGELLYADDSIFLKLKEARGKRYLPQTIKQKKILMQIFLDKFGERSADSVDEAEIENFLVSLDYSTSYKNSLLTVINELFGECKRLKIIKHKPEIAAFAKQSRRKDILTLEQLSILFPSDISELAEIWTLQDADMYVGVDGKCHNYGLMFGIMFRLMASTGLRPGECRAICLDQIKSGGLWINKMLDAENVLQHYLKLGDENNPKQRTVLLPEKMKVLLEDYIQVRPKSDTAFIFTFKNRFITPLVMETRFTKVLKKQGIFDKNKKLTPHSLRFTYNTYTVNSNLLPENVLRKMIGHNSAAMTDYYTRPDLDSQLAGLLPYQETINEIWDKLE